MSNKTHRLEVDKPSGLIIVTIDLGVDEEVWEIYSEITKKNIIKYHTEKALEKELSES